MRQLLECGDGVGAIAAFGDALGKPSVLTPATPLAGKAVTGVTAVQDARAMRGSCERCGDGVESSGAFSHPTPKRQMALPNDRTPRLTTEIPLP